MRNIGALSVAVLLVAQPQTLAFSTSRLLETRQSVSQQRRQPWVARGGDRAAVAIVPFLVVTPSWALSATPAAAATATKGGFIETELRGAAMRLHTTEQAPKEGGIKVEKPKEPYVPTHDDYLAFLVDSQHVYQAMEDIVNEHEELACFRNTGLERVKPLEQDIEFMVKEYNLERPPVGIYGETYAAELRAIAAREGSGWIPEFICHYYNHHFAHTAGGRMIGKQMSALLLNKKTLEFYKWDGDLNEIKSRVKDNIEEMAARWAQEEKDQCVAATAAAFRGGGMLNSYLMRGKPDA